MSSNVRSLYSDGSLVYAGGNFVTAGGTTVNYLGSWNGSVWSAVGTGMTGGTPVVNAVGAWAGVLVAAGNFTTAAEVSVAANNIAVYGAPPGIPSLVSPPDGATGQSVTLVLDWTDVTSAATYGVQVSTTPNFTSTVLNVSGLPASMDTVPGGTL